MRYLIAFTLNVAFILCLVPSARSAEFSVTPGFTIKEGRCPEGVLCQFDEACNKSASRSVTTVTTVQQPAMMMYSQPMMTQPRMMGGYGDGMMMQRQPMRIFSRPMMGGARRGGGC